MPKILDRLVKQLTDDGKSASAAHAIAVSQLKKDGILDSMGGLTAYGAKRQAMGPKGRAKSRAAKASPGHHKVGDYGYNSKTNLATLKKGK